MRIISSLKVRQFKSATYKHSSIEIKMELSKTNNGVELEDISLKTKHMEYIEESNMSNVDSSLEDNPGYGEVGNRPGIDRTFEENLSYWEIRRSNQVHVDQTVMNRNPAYGKMFIRKNVSPSTNRVQANKRSVHASKTLRTTVCIALLASCLAVAASVASIILLQRYLVVSKNEVDLLKDEIQQLREQLNQSQIEITFQRNNSLTDTAEMRDRYSTELNNIQSSVNTLNAVQDSMATQLNSQQSSIEALNTQTTQLNDQTSSLQITADTLTTQITSPVNLYQNCYEEIRICTIVPTGGTLFKRECSTSTLFISVQVKKMLQM